MTDQPQYPSPQPGPPPYQYPRYPQYPAGYSMQEPAYAQPVAPDGRPLAGQGQRLGARLIDSVIYLIAGAVLAGILGGGSAALLNSVGYEDSPVVPAAVITMIVVVIVGLQYLYEVEIPLRWNGQTPGKRMLKIAVIAMEPNLALSRGRLAYRFVVMLGFNLLSNCYVGLLDPLWCLWDKPYRQCLHDKPAKTVVIRIDPA
jgi:uncharacterized RDD family membrane protein YckC